MLEFAQNKNHIPFRKGV